MEEQASRLGHRARSENSVIENACSDQRWLNNFASPISKFRFAAA